jgi:hypothetical protein
MLSRKSEKVSFIGELDGDRVLEKIEDDDPMVRKNGR